MFFLLLVTVLFSKTPYLHYIRWAISVSMGGEELKWHQLAHNQLISPQVPDFSPNSTAKTNDKSTNLGKNCTSSGTSVVAFTSVYSEKTHLKKLIMIIITMNKSQETIFLAVARNGLLL